MRGLIGLAGVIGVVAFSMFTCGLAIYGLVLAFSASVVLGVLALFIQPSPLIFGICMFFFQKNLPEMIIQWLHK